MKTPWAVMRVIAPLLVRGACACVCLLPLSCAFGDADAVGSLFEDNEDPLFVAAGRDGSNNYALYSSPTGSIWSVNLAIPATMGELQFAMYGDGKFLSAGSSPNFYISTDGVLWGRGSTGGGPNDPGTLYDGVYANGRYVVVGQGMDGDAMAYSSEDGLFWIGSSLDNKFSGVLRGVAYGNGRFVAVGSQTGGCLVVSSIDGIVWSGNLRQASPMTLNDVTYGNGMFVAVGSGGMGAVSPDGITWSRDRIVGKDLTDLYGVAYGRDRFIAVGGSGSGAIYFSDDGFAWSMNIFNDPSLPALSFQDVTYCHGYFVSVTDEGSSYSSHQGQSWSRSSSSSVGISLYGITCRP